MSGFTKCKETDGLWSALAGAIVKIDDGNQVLLIAGSILKEGKLYIEAGSPEGSGQYLSRYVGAGLPKYMFEATRKKAPLHWFSNSLISEP